MPLEAYVGLGLPTFSMPRLGCLSGSTLVGFGGLSWLPLAAIWMPFEAYVGLSLPSFAMSRLGCLSGSTLVAFGGLSWLPLGAFWGLCWPLVTLPSPISSYLRNLRQEGRKRVAGVALSGGGWGQGDPLGNTSRDKYSPFGRLVRWLVGWFVGWCCVVLLCLDG